MQSTKQFKHPLGYEEDNVHNEVSLMRDRGYRGWTMSGETLRRVELSQASKVALHNRFNAGAVGAYRARDLQVYRATVKPAKMCLACGKCVLPGELHAC